MLSFSSSGWLNCLYACIMCSSGMRKTSCSETRKAEAGRDRPGEDSLLHRPAPPVLVGGCQPLIKTIVARVRRFLRGGGGGDGGGGWVGDPSDGDRDGGDGGRR
jgi:hypothetical protein